MAAKLPPPAQHPCSALPPAALALAVECELCGDEVRTVAEGFIVQLTVPDMFGRPGKWTFQVDLCPAGAYALGSNGYQYYRHWESGEVSSRAALVRWLQAVAVWE